MTLFNTQRSYYVTQIQEQRLESPTVTLTRHAYKYKVHKLYQRYILKMRMYLISSRIFLRMYLWWRLYTLYLHACQVRVTVGDSGLCCCICVTYFECQLTPLFFYTFSASFTLEDDPTYLFGQYAVFSHSVFLLGSAQMKMTSINRIGHISVPFEDT